MEWLGSIQSLPIRDIVLLALGIAGGGIVSLLIQRKALQRRELSVASESDRLIWIRKSDLSGIELRYQDQVVVDPRRTRFYIWNSGTITLEGSEIASAAPLTISGKDVRILRAEIISAPREVNRPKIETIDENRFGVGFDFLDPGDGLVIEAIYDQFPIDKPFRNALRFAGTIKGTSGSPKTRALDFQSKLTERVRNSTLSAVGLLFCLILIGFQTFEILDTSLSLLTIPKLVTWLVLLGLAIILAVVSVISLGTGQIPRSLMLDRSVARSTASSATMADDELEELDELAFRQSIRLEDMGNDAPRAR